MFIELVIVMCTYHVHVTRCICEVRLFGGFLGDCQWPVLNLTVSVLKIRVVCSAGWRSQQADHGWIVFSAARGSDYVTVFCVIPHSILCSALALRKCEAAIFSSTRDVRPELTSHVNSIQTRHQNFYINA